MDAVREQGAGAVHFLGTAGPRGQALGWVAPAVSDDPTAVVEREAGGEPAGGRGEGRSDGPIGSGPGDRHASPPIATHANGQRHSPRARRIPGAKVVVPLIAPHVLCRPPLEERLRQAGRHRLTVVTAAPGLGKTTLLASLAKAENCAWYNVGAEDADPVVLARGVLEAARLRVPAVDPTVVAPPPLEPPTLAPGASSSLLADVVVSELRQHLVSDVVLVLDDVHQLPAGSESARFLDELVRGSSSRLHVVLSSRADPPFPVARLRAQGLVLDLAGSHLRFTEAETRAVAAPILGAGGEELVARLHAATAGWPAAVRLVAEWVRDSPAHQRPARLERAGERGTPFAALLAEEVLPATPAPLVELVRALSSLERFTPGLAVELYGRPAEGLVATAARGGLWIVAGDAQRPEWLAVPPLVRQFLRSHLGPGPGEAEATVRRAAAWMEGQGGAGRAFAALLGTDSRGAARPLTSGTPVVTCEAAQDRMTRAAAPGEHHPGAFVEAGARLIRGDWDGVLAMVRPALAHDGTVPMAAGLLAGIVHHLRGELREALALYERGLSGPGNEALRAMLLGQAAAACWLLGDLERCRHLAGEAEAAADRSGDDRAAAVAHTALAMVAALDGDRRANDLHYLRALAHAEAAHDHVQIVRIRTNRGSRFLEEGHYHEALVELDEAVRLGELAGIVPFRALALHNRGEVLMALGRLDEAAREFEAARVDYERLGSRMTSYPLGQLGTVHRHQGNLTMARAYYEEAISIAEASGDLQGLVPALAGLALSLADADPEEAARLAERAVSAGPSLARPDALIAAAEVARCRGELAAAASRSEQASVAARAQRDRPALAEALEVQARLAPDPASAVRLLDEAATIWASLGNPLGEARVLLGRARLSGGPEAAALAADAEERLRRLGARTLAAEAARIRAESELSSRPALAVRVLGGFAAERSGVPVAAGAWQSRKARDLLKVLVARRGRPVPRDVLLDLLWGDEDPARAGSRLSVTLSTLRSVLDPAKRFGPEHFVAHDRAAAWLRLEHVAVDVERFLSDARAGLAALAAGDVQAAAGRLAAAEAAYAGEFLEEDPYEDWAVPLREEARGTYVSVAMALAQLARATGDDDGTARYLLRVLARDPYDERAHLQLVSALAAAGRHGDARRMYRTYCQRMAEIDVEPNPFPDARPSGHPGR